MKNPVFDEIRESLSSGSYFNNTDYNRAEEFFDNIPAGIQDKVNVCIVGVDNYIDIPVISGSITKCLKLLGGRNNVRLIVGPNGGFEKVTRIYGKRNELEMDVYDDMYDTEYSWLTRKKMRIGDMLRNAHVLIVFGSGPAEQFAYNEARLAGKLVKRFVPKIK